MNPPDPSEAKTPRTDAHRSAPGTRSELLVERDFARTLERENQSLRKAAEEFADIVGELLRFAFIEPDSVVDKVEAALAALRAELSPDR